MEGLPMNRNLTAVVLLLAVLAAPLKAFDTGHHADLTRAALSRFKFSEHAIQTVQVANWLTDYYSNSPTGFAAKAELAKLHFDCLLNAKEIDNYWKTLAANTRAEVKRVVAGYKGANDVEKAKKIKTFLIVLGISLHAVQDFYSHSNWVETHKRPTTHYETATWWSDRRGQKLEPERDLKKFYTGWYPGNARAERDKPTDAVMHGLYVGDIKLRAGNQNNAQNHDSYCRPRWDEAYVFAHAGTLEWVRAVLDWAAEASKEFSAALQSYQLQASNYKELKDDLEASWRISDWVTIPPGSNNDGHWKGDHSGDGVNFAAFEGMWMLPPDSSYVKAFTVDQVKKLTDSLYSPNFTKNGEIPPPGEAIPIARTAVLIRTSEVWKPNDDFVYARIRVGTSTQGDDQLATYVEATQNIKTREIQPNWWTIHFDDSIQGKVRVIYELFKQSGLSGPTESTQLHLSGKEDKALRFNYDFTSRLTGGDVVGRHDTAQAAFESGGNRGAKVRIYVTSTPVGDLRETDSL
jgi:hypothetical protein